MTKNIYCIFELYAQTNDFLLKAHSLHPSNHCSSLCFPITVPLQNLHKNHFRCWCIICHHFYNNRNIILWRWSYCGLALLNFRKLNARDHYVRRDYKHCHQRHENLKLPILSSLVSLHSPKCVQNVFYSAFSWLFLCSLPTLGHTYFSALLFLKM